MLLLCQCWWKNTITQYWSYKSFYNEILLNGEVSVDWQQVNNQCCTDSVELAVDLFLSFCPCQVEPDMGRDGSALWLFHGPDWTDLWEGLNWVSNQKQSSTFKSAGQQTDNRLCEDLFGWRGQWKQGQWGQRGCTALSLSFVTSRDDCAYVGRWQLQNWFVWHHKGTNT